MIGAAFWCVLWVGEGVIFSRGADQPSICAKNKCARLCLGFTRLCLGVLVCSCVNIKSPPFVLTLATALEAHEFFFYCSTGQ